MMFTKLPKSSLTFLSMFKVQTLREIAMQFDRALK